MYHALHVLPALILAAMVLVAGTIDRWRRPGGIALGLLSIGWLLTNQHMEGPTLVFITRAHGFTGGDLAGLAGLAIATWRIVDPAGQRLSWLRRRGG